MKPLEKYKLRVKNSARAVTRRVNAAIMASPHVSRRASSEPLTILRLREDFFRPFQRAASCKYLPMQRQSVSVALTPPASAILITPPRAGGSLAPIPQLFPSRRLGESDGCTASIRHFGNAVTRPSGQKLYFRLHSRRHLRARFCHTTRVAAVLAFWAHSASPSYSDFVKAGARVPSASVASQTPRDVLDVTGGAKVTIRC